MNLYGQYKIDCSIFIVTKGAGTIKLPLVEVKVYDYNSVKRIVDSLKSQYFANLSFSELAVQQSIKRVDSLYKLKDNWDYIYDDDKKYKPSDANLALWKSKVAEAESLSILYNDLWLKAKVEKTENTIQYELSKSPYLYFKNFPTYIAKSKTDGDGKCSFDIRKKGKYILVANSSRQVGVDKEYYYWIVSIDLVDKKQSIMLSNDNLFGSACSECIE
jgi:hypothetical protein